MFRMKLIVLSLLAMFALSLTATSTASALTNEFVINEKTISKGEKVEVQEQSLNSIRLRGEIAKINVEVECGNAVGLGSSSNVLEAEGKAKLRAEFQGCGLASIPPESSEFTEGRPPEILPSCKIGKEGTIVAEYSGELVQTEQAVIAYTGAGSSEITSTFEITEASEKSSCSLGNLTVAVKGKQACTFPVGFELEGPDAQLLCNPDGSGGLFMGKQGATESKGANQYANMTITPTKGQKLAVT